jgi:hypothetical protein
MPYNVNLQELEKKIKRTKVVLVILVSFTLWWGICLVIFSMSGK